MRWFAALALLIALPAAADSSLPAPEPGAEWTGACAAALKAAQEEAAREAPGFAAGRITVEHQPDGVHFVARIADAEHQRFFSAPAQFKLDVVQHRSKAPGTLGGDSGSAGEGQASLSLSRWTRRRLASMDVQIAEGAKVRLFSRLFRPAMEACLR